MNATLTVSFKNAIQGIATPPRFPSLVPRPAHRFWLHKRTQGPGKFSHVRDVKGRKDLIERGSEQQEEQRYEVTCNMYLASGGRLSCMYTPSVERVVGLAFVDYVMLT